MASAFSGILFTASLLPLDAFDVKKWGLSPADRINVQSLNKQLGGLPGMGDGNDVNLDEQPGGLPGMGGIKETEAQREKMRSLMAKLKPKYGPEPPPDFLSGSEPPPKPRTGPYNCYKATLQQYHMF